MTMVRGVTGTEAGLSGNDQILIALRAIHAKGGRAQMPEIYEAVEEHLGGGALSTQGKASLRYFVNHGAVEAGYIYKHDKRNPGWRITPKGKALLEREAT